MSTPTDTTTTTTETTRSIAGFTLETERGVTTVADGVVAKLAGHACREVDGVAEMGHTFRRLLGRITPGDESMAQGVNVEVGKKETAIDLVILAHYGYEIPGLAQEVRENVITSIESLTGLSVKEVNIEVDDLVLAEETSKRVE